MEPTLSSGDEQRQRPSVELPGFPTRTWKVECLCGGWGAPVGSAQLCRGGRFQILTTCLLTWAVASAPSIKGQREECEEPAHQGSGFLQNTHLAGLPRELGCSWVTQEGTVLPDFTASCSWDRMSKEVPAGVATGPAATLSSWSQALGTLLSRAEWLCQTPSSPSRFLAQGFHLLF